MWFNAMTIAFIQISTGADLTITASEPWVIPSVDGKRRDEGTLR